MNIELMYCYQEKARHESQVMHIMIQVVFNYGCTTQNDIGAVARLDSHPKRYQAL